MAAISSDAGVLGHFQDSGVEVAQGSHDLWSTAGADLGGAFAVAAVAEVMQYLDLPAAANPGNEQVGPPCWRPGWRLRRR
jgi:hypothetical protein